MPHPSANESDHICITQSLTMLLIVSSLGSVIMTKKVQNHKKQVPNGKTKPVTEKFGMSEHSMLYSAKGL